LFQAKLIGIISINLHYRPTRKKDGEAEISKGWPQGVWRMPVSISIGASTMVDGN
jgi:hypothetical protein